MTKQLLRGLVAGVVSLAWAVPASADIMVDDFTTQLAGGTTAAGGLLSSAVDAPQSSGTQAVSSGFSRLATVDNIPSVSGSASIQISGAGTADLASSAGNTNGAIISLLYTHAGIDLSLGTSIDFNVSVFDNGTNPPITGELFINDVSVGGPKNITGVGPLSFGFGAVDLSNVTKIRLDFFLNAGDDLVFNNAGGGVNIREIPEPASLALCGMVAAAGVWYSRRRRQAA